ncbi:MAG: helix-hairpin-helix domain-containing protein [Candidatus Latescibacterota bacterium]|jgi:DNA polymerase (family 10)
MVGEITDESRIDEKGRTRWQLNERIGDQLGRLGDYLVIGGYEESHTTVYKRLSYTISRWPESLETLRHEGRLKQLPSVGPTIQALLTELVDTGTCAKWEEWKTRVPESVLDLRDIPGLGAKMVRALYQEFGIDSLPKLRAAVDEGWLTKIPGLGPKTVTSIRRHLDARERGEVGDVGGV